MATTRPARRLIPCAVLAAALAAPAGRAPADTVLLKNGNRIQGEVLAEGPAGVTVRFPGGVLTIRPRDIASIEREGRLQYLLAEGEADLRRGDPEAALEMYRKARTEFPSSDAARAGVRAAEERRAEELVALGDHRAGIEAYRKILAEEPDHPRAAAAIGKIEAALRQGAADEKAGIDAARRGDADAAIERLRGVHDRFPERRAAVAPPLAAALIRSADRLLEAGKADEAETRYLEAAALDPDQAPAFIGGFAAARARRIAGLAERGQFPQLLEAAEDGLRIAPGSDELVYLAAIAHEGLGHRREAGEGYLRVARVERPKDVAKAVDALRRAAEERLSAAAGGPEGAARPPAVDPGRDEVLPGDFREIETPHFLVRHRNAVVGAEVAEAAEEAYRRIRADLALSGDWKKRCAVTIFPAKEDFQQATGQKDWTGGSHQIRRKMGDLTDHRIYSYQGQPRLASAVIPHEVAHAMLAFATGYGNEVPLWLNEGFAIHYEPSFVHRHYARIAAEAARSRRLVPLARLTVTAEYPSGDDAAKLLYAECFTAVDILFGEKRPADVAAFAKAYAAAPGALDNLLERFFRMRGTRALENRWLGSLRQ